MIDRYLHRDLSTSRAILPIVLDEANEIRLALAIGDGVLPDLPPGVLGNSEQCVLARALSNGWSATVDEGTTDLRHPKEGKLESEIIKSFNVLIESGFEGHWDSDAWGSTYWRISIDNTWAMDKFISLFDREEFPDLILDGS